MPNDVCNEITNPFSNFNGATVEVWEWIGNIITQIIIGVIIYKYMTVEILKPNIRLMLVQMLCTDQSLFVYFDVFSG